MSSMLNPWRYKPPFITEWLISVASTSITLPLENTGSYDFIVDWGDGNTGRVVSYNDPSATNIYVNAGTYDIRIYGKCTLWEVDNNGTIDTKITKVKQWGNVQMDKMNFHGCSNLIITATDILDTSSFTSFLNLFHTCSKIVTIPNINLWDVSNVTTLSSAFNGCTLFNDGNIDAWDTSNVTIFTSVFNNCVNFNQSLDSWNVSKGISFNTMFNVCTSFNQSLNSWVFNTVDTFSCGLMFENCHSFNGNITSWNMTNCISTDRMFQDCRVFNQAIGNWDMTGVTSPTVMFRDCWVFNQPLPGVNGWCDSGTVNLAQMMWSCRAFNQDLSDWNTINVTNMFSLFNDCRTLNQDLSGWNTAKVTNMQGLFNNADNFTNLGVSLASWDVSKVTTMYQMFSNMNWNPIGITGWVTTELLNLTFFAFSNTGFNRDISVWDVSKVTNFTQTFRTATSMSQDLSAWDISSATDMTLFGTGTAFSRAQYDLMLIAWSGLTTPPSNIIFGIDAGYTETQGESGTTDGTTAFKLIHSTATFLTSGVQVNDIIRGGGYCKVTAIDSDTQLSIDRDVFVSGEAYFVQTSAAAKGRYTLYDTYNWTITDGGPV